MAAENHKQTKQTEDLPLENIKEKSCGSLDYPVGVYYVDLNQMYLEHISWHWHEELEFNIINNGRARVTVGAETVELSAGQGIFINQNALHTITSMEDTNCTYYSIVFHPSFLFGYGHTLMSVKYLIPVLDAPVQYMTLSGENQEENDILEYLGNIAAYSLSRKYGMELMTKSQLCLVWMQLLHLLEPVNANPTKEESLVTLDALRVKQAITYIQDHYMQPISLEDIAESVHLSKSECCRCFKRALSLTPFEYLMKYRIYSSAKKIYRRDPAADSIAELAASVGFNNTSYFNKVFKKYLHCTPNTYKRTVLENPNFSLSVFGQPLSFEEP